MAKDANATLAMYPGAVEVRVYMRRSGFDQFSSFPVQSAVEHADYNDATTDDNRASV
jgi:hypothetical protein